MIITDQKILLLIDSFLETFNKLRFGWGMIKTAKCDIEYYTYLIIPGWRDRNKGRFNLCFPAKQMSNSLWDEHGSTEIKMSSSYNAEKWQDWQNGILKHMLVSFAEVKGICSKGSRHCLALRNSALGP